LFEPSLLNASHESEHTLYTVWLRYVRTRFCAAVLAQRGSRTIGRFVLMLEFRTFIAETFGEGRGLLIPQAPAAGHRTCFCG